MRHRKGNRHLGRTSAHARAMVRNTVANLFRHERITTTVKKAKLVRPWAEKMITLGKRGTLHARRQALAFLRSKPAVAKLFRTLGPRYVARNGGYTRIVRLAETIRPATSEKPPDFKFTVGCRLGDGAALAILELVEADVSPRTRRRRSRPEPFRPRREDFREEEAEAREGMEDEEAEGRQDDEAVEVDEAREADGPAEDAPAEEASAEDASPEDAEEDEPGEADAG